MTRQYRTGRTTEFCHHKGLFVDKLTGGCIICRDLRYRRSQMTKQIKFQINDFDLFYLENHSDYFILAIKEKLLELKVNKINPTFNMTLEVQND